jgi:hypothetical protein
MRKRPLDDVGAERVRHPWRQAECMRAVCRRPLVCRSERRCRAPQRRVVVDAVHAELRRAGDLQRGDCDPRLGERGSQLFRVGPRLQQQGILRLHTQDELHAAIEVEPELEGRPKRIDHPERERDDADDDEHPIASAHADGRSASTHADPPVHTKAHL